MNKNIFSRLLLPAAACAALAASPFNDYRGEYPGRRHRIRASDLPAPDPAESVNNGPSLVERPEGAWPRAPKGWKVELYAQGLTNPRQIRTAPNGDLFVAESAAGRIRILRGADAAGKAKTVAVFASGLRKPFGLAFYPPGPKPKYVYVGDTDAVLRFPYENGDLKARGAPEKIAGLPGGGFVDGGHWTRDVAFSRDGRRMFVSVGSVANVDDADTHPEERGRADILVFAPDGSGRRVYAYGLRNPVGLAVDPGTGALWTSVNERDRLGDNLPPDYVARVREGGFYGWPWYYMSTNGGVQDPRQEGKHPELAGKVITPDVLLNPHFASLELLFYEGSQFPAEYKGDGFAAEHGSWNRSNRSGYEVVRVPMKDGHATGEYEDFLTGFVRPDGKVWGRPVGVTVANDGSLFVTDDGSGSIWHVTYTGK